MGWCRWIGAYGPDPLIYTVLLERMAEVAVLISLFAWSV